MKKLLGIVVLYLLWVIPVSANERFIPLELFTGGEIRDDIEIRFTPADKIFGEKRRKKIVGPIEWLYLAAKGHRRAKFDLEANKNSWLVP